MAILPISSVNFNSTGRVNFKGDMEVAPKENNKVSGIRKYASVPVIVLMSLNPSLSAQAAESTGSMSNQTMTEMPAPSRAESDAEVMYAYASPEPVAAPAPQTSNQNPIKLQTFTDFESQLPYKDAKVLKVQKFSDAIGAKYALVYASHPSWGTKYVHDIYLFEKDKPLRELKSVTAIVYHDIGEDKEFCGLRVVNSFYDQNNHIKGVKKTEIKIPDELANDIYSLLADKLDYKNMTTLKCVDTNSEKLSQPIVDFYK